MISGVFGLTECHECLIPSFLGKGRALNVTVFCGVSSTMGNEQKSIIKMFHKYRSPYVIQ